MNAVTLRRLRHAVNVDTLQRPSHLVSIITLQRLRYVAIVSTLQSLRQLLNVDTFLRRLPLVQAMVGFEAAQKCYPSPVISNDAGDDRIPYEPTARERLDVCTDASSKESTGLTYEGELNKVKMTGARVRGYPKFYHRVHQVQIG